MTTHDKYGTARYYDIVVEGKTVKDGAWYYNGEKAGELKDWVGFRKSFGALKRPNSDRFRGDTAWRSGESALSVVCEA